MKREEEVRQIAYRLWEEAGCPEGCDVEHWVLAEREYDGDRQAEDADAEVPRASSDLGGGELPVGV